MVITVIENQEVRLDIGGGSREEIEESSSGEKVENLFKLGRDQMKMMEMAMVSGTVQ